MDMYSNSYSDVMLCCFSCKYQGASQCLSETTPEKLRVLGTAVASVAGIYVLCSHAFYETFFSLVKKSSRSLM